ncbi:MAG: Hsp20/alpha crystallin family protein [Kiritimatiellae bacterium]|nr:Hsp20/alpha crystallin family protein [Kiritimatiellia bacterium]
MTTEKHIEKKPEQRPAEKTELTREGPVFTPATDIYEKDDAICVVCDMPGVDEQHVTVSLENNVLTISGCAEPQRHEGYDLLHAGYLPGQYWRTFTLNEGIDRSRIRARMKQGVLRIDLPKAEEARPRTIAVESES